MVEGDTGHKAHAAFTFDSPILHNPSVLRPHLDRSGHFILQGTSPNPGEFHLGLPHIH